MCINKFCFIILCIFSFLFLTAQNPSAINKDEPANTTVPITQNSASPENTPKGVILTPTSWDFGKVMDSADIMSKSFFIENKTEQTISLFTLPTSCGCMIAKPVPDILQPGQTAELQTLFVPKGMRGVVQWDIKIQVEPTKEILIAHLKVESMLDSLLSEGVLNFRIFKRGTQPTITIWMAWWRDTSFKLLEVTSDLSDFEIKTQELERVEGFYPGPQRGYCIDVTPKKDIAYGRNNGKLFIKTNIPGHENITLPLIAHVIGDITAAPESLAFGLMKPGDKKTKQVIISHNELKPVKILGFTSTVPFISGTLQVVREDRYYYLFVTCECPESAQPGEFRGKILVQTDCPTHPEVVIYLQGIVKK